MDIKERMDKLMGVIGGISKLNIFIAQIDPDAIGSALGLMFIAQEICGKQASVYYAGHVAHPQNKCIINQFGLKRSFLPISEYKNEPNSAQALVDSSLTNDSRIKFPLEPMIVVDHHRGTDLKETDKNFIWVDDVGIGAASTMITEILVKILDGRKEALAYDAFGTVATLLALGIYSDTKSMISAGKRDREAYDFLKAHCSEANLYQLIQYTFSEGFFNRLEHALSTRIRNGSKIVTSVGSINENNADDLSTIADMIMRMEGITLVAVLGWMGDNIRISVRNRELGVPLDEFLKKRFPNMSGAKLAPDGRGEGGVLLILEDIDKLKILMGSKESEVIMREAIIKSIAQLFFTD